MYECKLSESTNVDIHQELLVCVTFEISTRSVSPSCGENSLYSTLISLIKTVELRIV